MKIVSDEFPCEVLKVYVAWNVGTDVPKNQQACNFSGFQCNSGFLKKTVEILVIDILVKMIQKLGCIGRDGRKVQMWQIYLRILSLLWKMHFPAIR